MTQNQWLLIIALAIGAYAIRFLGLVGGQALNHNPRLKPLLEDLPGCLLVALVGASLASQPPQIWVAAGIALIVAMLTNNVVITMIIGFLAVFGVNQFGGG